MRTPLPFLLLLLALFPPLTATTEARIGQDEQGNLVVSAEEGRRVIVNGIDVSNLADLVASQASALQSLSALASTQGAALSSLSSTVANLSALVSTQASTIARLTPNALKKLYVISGSANTSPLYSMEVLDGSSVWTLASSGPTYPHSYTPAVTFQGAIYVLGGWTTETLCERFDGRVWASTVAPALPRYGFGAAVYNSQLYIAGGFANPNFLSSVERFDGATWSAAPDLPYKRHNVGAVVYLSQLLIICGKNEQEVAQNSMAVFNGSAWASGPAALAKRHAMAVGVLGDHVYIAGGSDGTNILATVERYNGVSWAAVTPSLTTPRMFTHGAVFNGLFYVVGGSIVLSGSDVLGTVEVFNGTAWTTEKLRTARGGMAVAVL